MPVERRATRERTSENVKSVGQTLVHPVLSDALKRLRLAAVLGVGTHNHYTDHTDERWDGAGFSYVDCTMDVQEAEAAASFEEVLARDRSD